MNIALLISIIGAVIYLICTIMGRYPEVARLGEIAFGVGLLAFLLK